MLEAHPRGRESEGAGELDDTPLLHQRDGLKRLALASLLKDPLEDLVEAQGGNQQLACRLDRWGEEAHIRPVSEVLEPTGGIDDVQVRSSSRGTSVRMPLRKPRIFLMGRTGISSMRSS